MLLPLLYANLKKLRLKTVRFSSFLLEFFVLSSFPPSPYPNTAIGRQPRISAPNPFAPAAAFRHNPKRARISLEKRSLRSCFLLFLLCVRSLPPGGRWILQRKRRKEPAISIVISSRQILKKATRVLPQSASLPAPSRREP